MMFKFSKSVVAKSFSFVDEDIFFISEDTYVHSLKGKSFLLPHIKYESLYVAIVDDFIYFDDAHGNVWFYHRNTYEAAYCHQADEFKISIGFNPVILGKNKLFVHRRIGRAKSTCALDLTDFSLSEVDFEATHSFLGGTFVFDRFFDKKNNAQLRAVDPASGREIWKYNDLRDYKVLLSGEVKTESVDSIFAVVGDTLWLLLNTG